MISVIVPVYKTAKYIPQCLDSILAQTYKNLEVIVVNDASPDNSIDILRRYAAMDSRVRIVDKQVNEGLARARFSGMDVASGEWLTFVDSDDWLLRNDILDKAHSKATETGADYVEFCFKRVVDRFGRVGRAIPTPIYGLIEQPVLFDNYYMSFFGMNILHINIWGKLYRKSSVVGAGLTPSCVEMGEDLLFNLKLFPHLKKIYIMDSVGYAYRYGGMTSKYNPHLYPNLEYLFRLKLELIEKYNYNKAKDYVLIEIKNVLMSDVEQMILYKVGSRAAIEKIILERLDQPYWSMLKDVKAQADFQTQPPVMAILRKDASAIYNLAEHNNNSQRLVRTAKKVISKVCQILQ